MIVYNRSLASSNPPCSMLRTGVLYSDRSGYRARWDPKGAVFVHHRLTPPANDTWIEVTHCSTRRREGRPSTRHYWTYVTPDSGVRLYTGRTIGFATHAAAARSVGVRCADRWCIGGMAATFDAYISRGYDSVFFEHGEDAHRCGGGHAIELVFLRVRENERSACPEAGRHAVRDHRFARCRCVDVNDCARCL